MAEGKGRRLRQPHAPCARPCGSAPASPSLHISVRGLILPVRLQVAPSRFTGAVEEELPDRSEYVDCGSHYAACGVPLPENQEAARVWGRKCRIRAIGWMVAGVAALCGIIALGISQSKVLSTRSSFEEFPFGAIVVFVVAGVGCVKYVTANSHPAGLELEEFSPRGLAHYQVLPLPPLTNISSFCHCKPRIQSSNVSGEIRILPCSPLPRVRKTLSEALFHDAELHPELTCAACVTPLSRRRRMWIWATMLD